MCPFCVLETLLFFSTIFTSHNTSFSPCYGLQYIFFLQKKMKSGNFEIISYLEQFLKSLELNLKDKSAILSSVIYLFRESPLYCFRKIYVAVSFTFFSSFYVKFHFIANLYRLFWTMPLWRQIILICEIVHTYIGVSSQLTPRFDFLN